MKRVIEQAFWDALRPDARRGDGQLLESFLARRDEAAFAALVRRHAAMVLGVCRRVTGNLHDAEDAFQATFLVLLRKAAGVRPRERVGNWLYGVAYRTALEAKARNARRRAKERLAARPEAQADPAPQELSPILDRELSRLPEKYRLPVVLCDLEERSLKDVAVQLGWKEGTLSGRLCRARALLAKRLSRRGLTLSAGAMAAALAEVASAADRPYALARTTIKTVLLIAAGLATPAAEVNALVQGVLKAMLMTRIKIVTAVLAVLAATGLMANGLSRGTQAAEKTEPGPPDFTGKYLVVFADKARVATTLEKAQVKQLGDRSFLVGQVVKSTLTQMEFPRPGKTMWIPVQDVQQIVEYTDPSEVLRK